MIEINWKWIAYVLIAAILLIFFADGIVASAVAPEESETTITPAPAIVKAPMGNTSNGTIEVYQRDTIYWGDVCDLALVEGWYGKLIHESGKIVDVSSFTHKILIDPKVFPVGEWYQWADFDENDRTFAFYVQEKRPMRVNISPLVNTTTPSIKPYTQPIPIKHVGDILVARGDPLNIQFRNAKIWIFGRILGYYDYKTINNTIVLNVSDIQRLEPGTYTLVAEEYDNKSPNFFFRYDPENDRFEYFDPAQFKVMYVDMIGLDPRTRLERFRQIQKYTPDYFTEYTLIVEDPRLEITDLSQQYINKTTFSQTVRGYTNVRRGTVLTFIIDEDVQRRSGQDYSTFKTLAMGSDNPGDMRWFELTMPLLWENYDAGHHSITGTSAIGGSISVDYDVYEAPEHSFIPNNTIKYMNGSEWRADPTPLIIEKVVTQEIIKVVTKEIPVPPPQESVDKAQTAALFSLVTTILVIVLGCILGGGAIWYYRSVYTRAKFRKTFFKGGLK